MRQTPKSPLKFTRFLDGRDTPPRSALTYVDRLSKRLEEVGSPNAIATVIGRFYAMDRDKRWDRVERAYEALARGKAAFNAPNARMAIEAAYARDESDEFVQPTLIGAIRPIRDGDSAIFFNFRPDRARELTMAFTDPSFSHFDALRYKDLIFATMTRYEESFPNPVLFGPRPQSQTFGEIVAEAGLRQLRLAETEKYAHVTYFFNGGREDVFENEDRILIPSNRKVATYDLAPEMMAAEITTAAIDDLDHKHHDVIVMNYANADMVGHTGVWDATVSAVETLDVSLGRLEQRVLARDGILVITADHGNAEEKIDPDGNPLTAHTTSPVPLVIVSQQPVGKLAERRKAGRHRADALPLMGLRVPGEMTGDESARALAREAAISRSCWELGFRDWSRSSFATRKRFRTRPGASAARRCSVTRVKRSSASGTSAASLRFPDAFISIKASTRARSRRKSISLTEPAQRRSFLPTHPAV